MLTLPAWLNPWAEARRLRAELAEHRAAKSAAVAKGNRTRAARRREEERRLRDATTAQLRLEIDNLRKGDAS